MLSRREFMHLSAAALAGANVPFMLTGCSDGGDGNAPFEKIPLPQDAMGRWWLSNNYAPVQTEQEAFNLPVVGELPQALNGVYARIASNQDDTNHWFLGHGMLHGVQLRDGDALWYRSRYVQTLLRDTGTDELDPLDPNSSYSNVAPIYHAGRLLTMGEIGFPYEISAETLSTEGVYNFDGQLKGSMTAHPKIDPITGEMLFFGYSFFPPFATFYQANTVGVIERSVDITLPASVMMHDFAITENHVIFYDLPVVFSFDKVNAGSDFPFAWSPEHTPRMGIMPRDGGDADIVWFEVESGFVFHTMNAYENPQNSREIILECSRIEPPFWQETTADLSKPSYLTRYRFNLDSNTVSELRLVDTPMDFGQVNRNLIGQPYRYGYGLDFSESAGDLALPSSRAIARRDHQAGTTEMHRAAADELLSEAIFVPDPGGSSEQDGWLMSYAFNQTRCLSDLLVIDARDFTAPPVARVELPYRVPFGFHGVWVPE